MIVPAVTWPTTVTPILQHGCVPVLVDVDPHTLNLRPERLHEALSSRTRAIMPVHLLGNPVNMGPLMAFAAEHDLWVVEDTCESLGSSIGDRQVGSFGHLGTYSFFFSHHITTIEGGMLVTNDDQMADLARSMRAHGWTRDMANRLEIEQANPWIDPRFLFVNIGYNLRPTEIQGAFGLVQLDRLNDFNEQRRKNAKYLLNELRDLSDHLEFVTEQEGARSTWFGFTVMLPDGGIRRDLSRHLEARGIATRPIVAGNLAIQPAFRDNPHRIVGPLANATRVGERGLFIGNHPNLTSAHLEHIVSSFRAFFASVTTAIGDGPGAVAAQPFHAAHRRDEVHLRGHAPPCAASAIGGCCRTRLTALERPVRGGGCSAPRDRRSHVDEPGVLGGFPGILRPRLSSPPEACDRGERPRVEFLPDAVAGKAASQSRAGNGTSLSVSSRSRSSTTTRSSACIRSRNELCSHTFDRCTDGLTSAGSRARNAYSP